MVRAVLLLGCLRPVAFGGSAPALDDISNLLSMNRAELDNVASLRLDKLLTSSPRDTSTFLQAFAKSVATSNLTIDDETKEVLKGLQVLLVGTTDTNLKQSHMDDQALINKSHKSVEECKTDTNDSVDKFANDVANLGESHSKCRTELNGLIKIEDDACGDLHAFNKGTTPPNAAFPVSAKSEIREVSVATDLESFYSEWHAFVVSHWQPWNQKKAACDLATKARSEKDTVCDTQQTSFESKTCELRSASFASCSSCRTLTLREFETNKHYVLQNSKNRKMDWRDVAKLKCFIGVLLTENPHGSLKEELDKCTDKSIETIDLPSDVNKFDIHYPSSDDTQTCHLEAVQVYPCSGPFASLYESFAGVQECTPCSELPDFSRHLHADVNEYRVYHDNFVYQTLYAAEKDGSVPDSTEEQIFKQMPDGFEVAPDGTDIAQKVINPHNWNVWRLCTWSQCWGGKLYGDSVSILKNSERLWETDGAGNYRIINRGEAWYRLLIRKPMQNPATHVFFEGYVYRSLYETLLDDDRSSGTEVWLLPDEERTYKEMPEGYEIAPDEDGIVQFVVARHEWNQWRMCTFSKCWAGANYGAEAGVLKDDAPLWESDGNRYRIKDSSSNWYRILIRKKLPPPHSSREWHPEDDISSLAACKASSAKFGITFETAYEVTVPELQGCYSYLSTSGHACKSWYGLKMGGLELTKKEMHESEAGPYPGFPGLVALSEAAKRFRLGPHLPDPQQCNR